MADSAHRTVGVFNRHSTARTCGSFHLPDAVRLLRTDNDRSKPTGSVQVRSFRWSAAFWYAHPAMTLKPGIRPGALEIISLVETRVRLLREIEGRAEEEKTR